MSLFEIFVSRLGLIGAFVPSLILYFYYQIKSGLRPWFATIVIGLAAITFVSLCIVVFTQWYYGCPTWLGDCYSVPIDIGFFIELIKLVAFYLVPVPILGVVGLVNLTAIASATMLVVSIINYCVKKRN